MRTILNEDIERVLRNQHICWSELEDSAVFVTGATGFIGSLIVKTLIAYQKSGRRLRIYAMMRDPEKGKAVFGEDYSRITPVVGDIREAVTLPDPVDFIIHCASVTTSKYMVSNPVETFQTALQGTANLLELAKTLPLKCFLYISSMEVYGLTRDCDNPVSEEIMGAVSLDNPRSSYPCGKRACEFLCNAYFSQYHIPARTARLALTFGPGMPLTDNRISMQFARSAQNGTDIVLHTHGRSVSNFCYSSDTLTGIFTILTRGENGQAYNVCNDVESRTVSEIAKLVAERVAKAHIAVIYDIPEENAYGYAPDSVMRLNSGKLKQLGWQPETDLETAYRRFIMYLDQS